MKAFPLIRRRWSNEHIMAALFIVILMYLLPQWINNHTEIVSFLITLSFSLLLDSASAYIRHKRLVCSVSAAVTAAILQVLTPGIPLWGRLLGAFSAIIVAKQIWGGTGKNILNPAIVGYMFIQLIFDQGSVPLVPSIMLIPALILSLPFVLSRPFVSAGYMGGMLLSYLTGGISSWQSMIVNSIFFGCIILTDPVTITPFRAVGFIGGFAVALLPTGSAEHLITFMLLILIFNLISYLIDDYFNIAGRSILAPPFRIGSPFRKISPARQAINLTGHPDVMTESAESSKEPAAGRASLSEGSNEQAAGLAGQPADMAELTIEAVLNRIKSSDVYGLSGSGFPTYTKIKTVMESNAGKKYFIINGAECDPGLIHDKWLLINRADEISKGIKAIRRCIDFSDVFLAVKNTEGLKFANDIRVCKVSDFYPAGFEKVLIRSILRKKIPVDFVPAKLGILVLNVQTVLSVYEAVYNGRKAGEKYITVADLKTGIANVVKVRTGDRISNIMEKLYPDRYPVFVGGGIMQSHMAVDDEAVGKETNFICVSDMPKYKESPLCSNCGSCAMNCPQRLMVKKIADLVDLGKYDEAKKYGPEKCINCGLCSYVCLAGKNLSGRVGDARRKVLL